MDRWDAYCERGIDGCLDQNCGCVDTPEYRERSRRARIELQVGATYRARRPRKVVRLFAESEWNDRTIIWMDGTRVQYDGPAVKFGSKYPTTTIEKFLAWAGHRLEEN